MTPSANEERRNRVDVAVIGCGPTGLTLARLLEQENLTVAVIDRSWLPMERSRATHLDDETMRTFHQVGAGHLEPTFAPVGTYRHYDADRRIIMEMELNRGLTDQAGDQTTCSTSPTSRPSSADGRTPPQRPRPSSAGR
ncbi:3-(3-hydroxy-phenyl)propionate/3-hydroxycinnamic acid hydroxylase [Streptomyces antimycoticus]